MLLTETGHLSWLLEAVVTFALMFECIAIGLLIHRRR
jgi:hypothetical protein